MPAHVFRTHHGPMSGSSIGTRDQSNCPWNTCTGTCSYQHLHLLFNTPYDLHRHNTHHSAWTLLNTYLPHHHPPINDFSKHVCPSAHSLSFARAYTHALHPSPHGATHLSTTIPSHKRIPASRSSLGGTVCAGSQRARRARSKAGQTEP